MGMLINILRGTGQPSKLSVTPSLRILLQWKVGFVSSNYLLLGIIVFCFIVLYTFGSFSLIKGISELFFQIVKIKLGVYFISIHRNYYLEFDIIFFYFHMLCFVIYLPFFVH